jgi:hypothetical protein
MKVRNPNNVTLKFLNADLTSINEVAYFDDGISAGFPSPADDF